MIMQEHISLINVDASQNKWRGYTIQISLGDDQFVVVCSWGRLYRYRRNLSMAFEEKKNMEKFIETLLKRRHRSGYQIISMSEKFPHSPTLSLLPVTDNVAGQLKLF